MVRVDGLPWKNISLILGVHNGNARAGYACKNVPALDRSTCSSRAFNFASCNRIYSGHPAGTRVFQSALKISIHHAISNSIIIDDVGKAGRCRLNSAILYFLISALMMLPYDIPLFAAYIWLIKSIYLASIVTTSSPTQHCGCQEHERIYKKRTTDGSSRESTY